MVREFYIVGAIIAACFIAAVVAAIRKIIKGEYGFPATDTDAEYEEFCRKHHLTASDRPDIRINPDSIPEDLRPLIPLAERWGISDDVIRFNCIKAASREERAELLCAVDRHRSDLTAWLKKTDVTQSDDWWAVAFMDTAAAEMEAMGEDLQPGNPADCVQPSASHRSAPGG